MDTRNSSAISAQSPPAEQQEVRKCRSCYGAGMVTEDIETAFGWYEAVQSTCPICQGSGQVFVFLYGHARTSR